MAMSIPGQPVYLNVLHKGITAVCHASQTMGGYVCAGCHSEGKQYPTVFKNPTVGYICSQCNAEIIDVGPIWTNKGTPPIAVFVFMKGIGQLACDQNQASPFDFMCQGCVRKGCFPVYVFQNPKVGDPCPRCFCGVSVVDYYPQGGGQMPPKASGQCRIWWDTQVQAYRLTSPFCQPLIDFLKSQIPANDRSWDKPTKIWTFSEKWLAPIELLVKQLYQNPASVVSRADAEKAQVPPATAIAKMSSLQDQFFELIPYDAMRRAYLLGIQQLHPDRGGDSEKASRLNAVWQRLEKDFYKK